MNVIFDMDGLMFDTEKVFIKAWDYAGERIGIGKAGYMVYKTLGMSIVASYEIWNEEFGDRYNQEELRKYTKEFLKNYYENNKVPLKQKTNWQENTKVTAVEKLLVKIICGRSHTMYWLSIRLY